MANSTSEVITVDGVSLKTYAKNIETLAATLRVPAVRGENIVVPGRQGRLRPALKPFDQNAIVWPMWLVGADDDGNIPGGSTARKEFFKRVDELTALFGKHGQGLLDVRHTLPDGSVRQCYAEVEDIINFASASFSEPMAKFNVVLTIPAAFFQDVNTVTYTSGVISSGQTLTMGQFQGATAPMDDLTFTWTGPVTNPRITDTASGNWVQANVTVAAGQLLVINCALWTATNNGVSCIGNVTHGLGARLLTVTPDATTRDVKVTITGTGMNTSTRLSATGRRKYLVG